MAGNHTEHYGLSLWEPGDAFVRTEFNGDHERVDAALHAVRGEALEAVGAARTEALQAAAGASAAAGAAQTAADRALAGLLPVSYNVYNLVLRDYYEKKETGFKRAMVFDGFLDESRIAAKSAEITVQAAAARLSAAGQRSITSARTGNAAFLGDRACGTATFTAVGGGTLRSITLEWYAGDSQFDTGSCLSVTLNGVGVRSQNVVFPAGGGNPLTFTLDQPVTLVRGDRFSLALSQYASSRAAHIYLNAQGTMAGTVTIDPVGAAQGTLTATAAETGAASRKSAVFVRYSGGSVTPAINGKAMTRTGRRDTVNLQGESCTEDAFEGPGTAGSVAMGFTLDCGGGPECVFYDYGVILL